MNKLFVLSVLGFNFLFASFLHSAPGQVNVSVESSTDLITWSSATTGDVDVSTTEPFYRIKIVPVDGGDPGYTEIIQSTTTHPGKKVIVSLFSSNDLSTWSQDVTGIHNVSGSKKFFKLVSNTLFADFITVAAGSLDEGTLTVDTFILGEFEVTIEEWNQTYAWAIQNGYDFSDSHEGCDLNHPVQQVSWYDVVKWCNARSQQENLLPAYYTDDTKSTVYKTGDILVEENFVDSTATGYRLPTDNEWEFAARGGTSSGDFLYSGSDAPGSVAIYSTNSSGTVCDFVFGKGTYPIADLASNELGFFDMSGNVYEFVFDSTSDSRRSRGGGFLTAEGDLPVASAYLSLSAGNDRSDVGFRLAKNIPIPVASSAIVEASTAIKSTKKPNKRKPLKASKR